MLGLDFTPFPQVVFPPNHSSCNGSDSSQLRFPGKVSSKAIENFSSTLGLRLFCVHTELTMVSDVKNTTRNHAGAVAHLKHSQMNEMHISTDM